MAQEKELVLACASDCGPSEAARRAHAMPGYESVTRVQIVKWRKAIKKQKGKRGRKGTKDTFNQAVLGTLVFGTLPIARREAAQWTLVQASQI